MAVLNSYTSGDRQSVKSCLLGAVAMKFRIAMWVGVGFLVAVFLCFPKSRSRREKEDIC